MTTDRREFLHHEGVLATGGLIVAAKFVPARTAFAAYATSADKMPHGVRSDPHLFVSIARQIAEGVTTQAIKARLLGEAVRCDQLADDDDRGAEEP